MGRFNKKEFGNKIREVRKSRGLSLENIGNSINKTASTIARYENGEILPDAETISLLCDELQISEYELFNTPIKLNNKDKSKNPFGVNTLYLYYKAFFSSTKKFGNGKFKLNIIEKENLCKVDFVDYKTNKIYMSGHIVSDDNICVFILENYKPNSPRLEITEIILNISNGMDKEMLGTLYCTNGKYIPSIRKCIISKKDLDFNEQIKNKLKISDNDKSQLINEDVLYIDIDNIDDYEE
mgnify:CR=1 FL=1